MDFPFIPSARCAEWLLCHIEDRYFDSFAGQKYRSRTAHDSGAKDGNSGSLSHLYQFQVDIYDSGSYGSLANTNSTEFETR